MTLTLLFLACRPAPPPPEPVPIAPATRWVEGPAGIVLEVASDRYDHPDGRRVEILGAVHVAEGFFYAASVARLEAHDAVRFEGLIDDEGGDTDEPRRVAEAYGLVAQSSIDTDRPGWSRSDLTVSTLKRRMADAGVDAATVRELLGHPDDPPPEPLEVATGGTQQALAQLALVKQLAKPPSDDPPTVRWILEERDRHVVDALIDEGLRDVGLWYGADHLPGMGQALQEAGYRAPERTWTPAIAVGFDRLQLGPAQVKMLLNR